MPELLSVPFVVFCNKIDKARCLNEEEIREILELEHHKTYGKGEQSNMSNQKVRVT